MSISTDHAISWPFPMVSLRERKCWENPQDPSFFLDKAPWCLFYPIDMYMIWVTHKIVAIIYCNTNLVLLRLGLAKGCAKPSLRDDPIPIPLFCMSRLKVCERRNPHDPNYLICAWRWTWTSNFVRYIYIYTCITKYDLIYVYLYMRYKYPIASSFCLVESLHVWIKECCAGVCLLCLAVCSGSLVLGRLGSVIGCDRRRNPKVYTVSYRPFSSNYIILAFRRWP